MGKKQAIELVKDGLRALMTYPADIDTVTEDTMLISKEGWSLDSFGMTTLIIELEALIEQKYQKQVSLIGDKLFSITTSPFRTVGTLAEYIMELVK